MNTFTHMASAALGYAPSPQVLPMPCALAIGPDDVHQYGPYGPRGERMCRHCGDGLPANASSLRRAHYALTTADAELLEQAMHDLVQNGETTVPAADLRRFAAMELLECTQWRVLPSAQVAIDAAREEGGAA